MASPIKEAVIGATTTFCLTWIGHYSFSHYFGNPGWLSPEHSRYEQATLAGGIAAPICAIAITLFRCCFSEESALELEENPRQARADHSLPDVDAGDRFVQYLP